MKEEQMGSLAEVVIERLKVDIIKIKQLEERTKKQLEQQKKESKDKSVKREKSVYIKE